MTAAESGRCESVGAVVQRLSWPYRGGKAHWPPRAQYYVALVGQWALPERVGSSEGLGLAGRRLPALTRDTPA